MSEEFLIPIVALLLPAIIVWIVFSHNAKSRQATQETIRKAIDSGQQLTPEVIQALGAPRRRKGGDLRWGLIWVSVAVAWLLFSLSIGQFEEDAFYGMVGIAAFPGLVGLALIAMHFMLGSDKN